MPPSSRESTRGMGIVNCYSGSVVKNLQATRETQETWARSLGQEDPLREGNGNPLQYSSLENPTDREAWRIQSMGLQRIQQD